MPTSIAHAFGGLAAAEGSSTARGWSRTRVLVFCAVVANLPDLDFLPGAVLGDAGRFHRHFSHSLLATLLVALAFALWERWRRHGSRGDAARVGWLAFLVYGSHLVLDTLVATPTDTSGVPLFAPFSPARYYTVLHLPAPLATLLELDIDKNDHFFHAVFSIRGAEVFLGHALLFAPLPIVAWLIRRAVEGKRAPRRRSQPGFAPTAAEAAAED